MIDCSTLVPSIDQLDPSRVHAADVDVEYNLQCYTNSRLDHDNGTWRGAVFSGDKFVFSSFSHCIEITADADLEAILPDPRDLVVHASYEGCLIRLFYYKDRWFISTHRRLDAFNSYWAEPTSFGKQFEDSLHLEATLNSTFCELVGDNPDTVLSNFLSCLDKSCGYLFLLRPIGHNRIVCQPDFVNLGSVIYIATIYNKTSMCYDDPFFATFPRSERLHFNTLADLRAFVSESNPMQIQGVLCTTPSGEQIKVLSPMYEKLFEIRGNERDIVFRYASLETESSRLMLRSMYPECATAFYRYDQFVQNLALRVYNLYVEIFIQHRYVPVSSAMYVLLRRLHDFYLQDREKNRMTRANAASIISAQPVILIYNVFRG
jgi:hypothetical protein